MKSKLLVNLGSGLLGAAICLALSAPAWAQAAKVTAVQAVAEKRSGEAAWKKAPVGTELRTGDRVRTGKRSKADLKFGDGSLIRLGQLSTLEVQNEKQVQLSGGRLLFSFLKPGRILAGAGAAEIKGTVGIVALDDFGNVTYSLYSGVLDVTTALRTFSLQPGKFITLRPNGTVLRTGDAAPLEYADGTRNPELLTTPVRGPYSGSRRQIRTRESTQQQSLDPIIDTVRVSQGERPNPSEGRDDDVPLPIPFPTPATHPVPTPFPTISPGGDTGDDGGIGTVGTLVARRFSTPASSAKTVISRSNSTILLAQAPPTVRETAPEATGVIPTPDLTAEQHLGDADSGLGRSYGSDARFIGALADEGGWAAGGRLHGYVTKGRWLVDAAVVPLRIARRAPGGGNDYDNRTNITDLSVTYRNDNFQIEAGRIRHLAGPSQATLFGSLIRQGGREITDAVRITPYLSSKDRLEVSYLFDAFVRDLPYNVGGRQKGFFGRYERRESFGNFGVNLLKYTNTNVDDTFGATVDFAVPVINNQLEFYGEAGRDQFRRRLTSFGIYLPGLYQKTGLDVYLEWAQLKGSSVSAGAPDETALRVYKRINKYADAMITASRFKGGDSSVILGVSIGDPVPEE